MVFAPKCTVKHYQAFYGEKRRASRQHMPLRQNCVNGKRAEFWKWNVVQIYIHMLLEIPPKMSVSSFGGISEG
ncbi:hypothetical protein KCP77_18445 [Salmonella enterica subsp. enterica]|nr:hypothetical protein KCP77_18445 [Salmonella enterica subsp. enterica]